MINNDGSSEIVEEKVVIRETRRVTKNMSDPYGKVINARIVPYLSRRVDKYKANRNIKKDSVAFFQLLKTGLDVDDLQREDIEAIGLPVEIDGLLDGLTIEQAKFVVHRLQQKIEKDKIRIKSILGN